jgi:D-sedoheptulose 7-phosphate isomerase
MEIAARYLDDVVAAAHAVDLNAVLQLVDRLESAYRTDRQVFAIGNGGSASNASHFAEDLCKGALQDSNPKRFRVLSLTDNTSFITAIGNDLGYDRIFEFQLRQFAKSRDILIAISGSGNSPNIIRAVEWALQNGLTVVGFTGFNGGKLRQKANLSIHVPIQHMCKTEAVHAILLHMATDLLKDRIGGPRGAD